MVGVLLVASLQASALPTPSPGPFFTRGPISITNDSGFTAANGVVGGAGTPSSPYVIAGWSITTSGTGISIRNVTKHFVVRDNSIDAAVGIDVRQSSTNGAVVNNKLVVRGTGIFAANADPLIIDNSFVGDASMGYSSKGVDLVESNARVESNAFIYVPYAVRAERGSPQILCNDLHDDTIVAGITLRFTTNATIACNIITRCVSAIAVAETIGTIIANNSITSCYVGITVRISKDATVANNTVRGITQSASITIDTTSGNVTGNVVLDGQARGVVIVRSPVLVANNTVSNHLQAGVWIGESEPVVHANVVSNNAVGIVVQPGSVPHLSANVVSNNTVGLDIPYGARQAIVHMEANVVNGVNVDGALDASQQVYFYQRSNVTISGQVRDSGFSAGYYGSLTAQGGVVLYDVDTATIESTVISHQNVGVGIVNAFNVNVNDSLLVSNLVGVQANATPTGTQAPPCVVGVKRTNITIPVDPVATVGIDLRGCLGIVANVNVSVVDTGVRVDGGAALQATNLTVTETKIGLDVAGRPNEVNVTGALIAGNRVGARFSNTIGVLAESRFEGNAEVAIRLENGARMTMRANNVTRNGAGVVDVEPCAGLLTCSALALRDNAFVENDGAGLVVNGGATLRGDAFLGNAGDGARVRGGATLRGVLAAGNEGSGAIVTGKFLVEESRFEDNGVHGLDVNGNGELRDSAFLRNELAGIRIESTYINAVRLNVSFNRDGILAGTDATSSPGVPPLNVPGVVGLVTGDGGAGGPDPFDVHLSVFLGNERDALRAGTALVNATHNYWGRATGPSVSVADTLGAFQNGVSPGVRFLPYFADAAMTTTGPAPGL